MDLDPLTSAIARLARAATAESSADQLLTELCLAAGPALEVDHVGVMASDGHRTRYVATDSALVVPVEQLQEALQEGPCFRAVALQEPVVVTDLRVPDPAQPWPQFALLAVRLGLGAVVAVPLVSRGRTWGTLDLYRGRPHVWTRAEVAGAVLLADVAVSYLVMASDRDDARAAQQALSWRTLHDDLTGLPNRTLLFERLRHALLGGQRLGTALALVFVDVDGFKAINDTFGHTAGDLVLVTVAERLTRTLRAGDTFARLAGDEFVLVAENLPVGPPALGLVVAAITDRLVAALAQPVRYEGLDIRLSASVGVAVTTQRTAPEDLLHDADVAMYEAKRRGPGRVVVHDRTVDAGAGWTRQLERDLPSAVRRGELVVHYQVIQEASSGRAGAVEALLRWQHPVQGLVPAARFVDLADRSGLLPGIGRRLIGRAVADLAGWRAELGERAPSTVWCNLSPAELADPALDDAVATALQEGGLQPHHLGLEVVEAVFADPAPMVRLGALRRRGHPLSVDDVGTGRSSVSRLVDLPVVVAKIDRSLVSGLPEDDRSRALVEAVLLAADGLALEVVAEGVETQAQQDYLVAAGCQQLQGYLIGRPMSSEDLVRTLGQGPPVGS